MTNNHHHHPIQRLSRFVKRDEEIGDQQQQQKLPNDNDRKPKTTTTTTMMMIKPRYDKLICIGMTTILVVLGMILTYYSLSKQQISSSKSGGYYALIVMLACPIGCIISIALGRRQLRRVRVVRQQETNNRDNRSERMVASAFVASIIGNQFPKIVGSFAAAVLLVLFGLVTRPVSRPTTTKDERNRLPTTTPHRDDDDNNTLQQQQKTKTPPSSLFSNGKTIAVFSSLIFILVMLIENFFVWVVSATYYPSHHTNPPPLQDNGRILLNQLFDVSRDEFQSLRDTLNIQWALVAALGGSFVCCELNWTAESGERRLWGIALRSLTTLACVRAIRTVSFLLTVLPSQVPNCYDRHFPEPPSEWSSWILIGLLPNSRGGCNDLIISGHATITSVIACIITSIADNTLFAVSISSLLFFDYTVEVIQGLHYSVDMWLGAVITCLLWRNMAFLEYVAPKEPPGEFYPLSKSTTSSKHVVVYSLPAIVAWIAVALVPESIANGWVIGMFAWTVGIVVRNGGDFTQYAQHVLICTLYLGLGIYL